VTLLKEPLGAHQRKCFFLYLFIYVRFPPEGRCTAPIDITVGKVVGALKSMPGPDSCATDSSEDKEGEDTHKLCQIAQAIHKGQPVTISIRGQFQGYQKDSEVLFQRDHKGAAPTDILDPMKIALLEIAALSTHYETEGIQGPAFGREQ
jgi:hypothetical protein